MIEKQVSLDAPESRIAQIRIKGRNHLVPSLGIQDKTVVLIGRWPRIATIRDEDFIEGVAVEDAERFLEELKQTKSGADLLTFTQKFPDLKPRHGFYMEWDNVAAVPITTYDDWWNRQISGNLRKIIKRSARRGVSVETVEFNDAFVNGVVGIYNENPIRQHRTFWHYGKGFDAVKTETGTYLDRSIFVGAYWEGKLIGFLKIVLVDRLARLMQIVSMTSHNDKLPTNSLIAKAVEVSAAHGCTHLTYGKYTYGKMGHTSLTEFKKRNGFRQYLLPRYYIPLTVSGEIAMRLGMHRPLKDLVPENVLRLVAAARARYSRLRTARNPACKDSPASDGEAENTSRKEAGEEW